MELSAAPPRSKGRPSTAQRLAWQEMAPGLATHDVVFLDGDGFIAKLIPKKSISTYFAVSEETVDAWIRDFRLPVTALPETGVQAVPVMMFIDAFLANPERSTDEKADIDAFRHEVLKSIQIINRHNEQAAAESAVDLSSSLAQIVRAAAPLFGGDEQ
jgi:hypothetical protein